MEIELLMYKNCLKNPNWFLFICIFVNRSLVNGSANIRSVIHVVETNAQGNLVTNPV